MNRNMLRVVGIALTLLCAGPALSNAGEGAEGEATDADRELTRQLEQVEESFPMVSRSLEFLRAATRFCAVDQVCFRALQDNCLQNGLPPQFCLDSSREACCKTPVLVDTSIQPAEPGAATTLDDLTGVLVTDASVGQEPSKCTDPRPSDIGCSRLCKPCTTFVCLDGEWKPQEITFPEGLCDPRGDLDPPFKTCPRTSTGFCPAECHLCF